MILIFIMYVCIAVFFDKMCCEIYKLCYVARAHIFSLGKLWFTICICIFTWFTICICIFTCMSVCMYTYAWTCINPSHLQTYIHVNMYKHAHMSPCLCSCMHTRQNQCTHHTNTNAHAYNVYIYIYKQKRYWDYSQTTKTAYNSSPNVLPSDSTYRGDRSVT